MERKDNKEQAERTESKGEEQRARGKGRDQEEKATKSEKTEVIDCEKIRDLTKRIDIPRSILIHSGSVSECKPV